MTKKDLIKMLDGYDDDEVLDVEETISMISEAYDAEMHEHRMMLLEERQHDSGMYVQQDIIDMYRRER